MARAETENPTSGQPMLDIKTPHNNDCLCGRGVTTNKWPGNEQFRSLVGLNKELYVTSTKRQKMEISRSVVEAVRTMDPPGRFLEKNPSTGLWKDIGDRKAIEKTSQALRDGAAALRKQLSEDLGDPDFLSAVFDVESSNDVPAPKSSSAGNQHKPKEKPIKAKTVKKCHRRTQSMPNSAAAVKHSYGRSPVPSSPISRRSPSRLSHSSSPRTSSPFGDAQFYSSTPPPPPLGETGSFYGEMYGERHNLQHFSPQEPRHRRRHTHTSFQHPGSPPRPVYNHGGYWHGGSRPPMPPMGRWSPSMMMTPMSPDRAESSQYHHPAVAQPRMLSPMSFRALANIDHAPPHHQHHNLSMPQLAPTSSNRSSPAPPPSPRRQSSNTITHPQYPTPPASPRDFTPPLSPRSPVRTQKRVVLTASPHSNNNNARPVETTSAASTSSATKKAILQPTDVQVVSSSATTSTTNINCSHNDNDKQRLCESPPLHGDKIVEMEMDTNPADDDPIPFDAYDSGALMEISDEIMRLPIASVGHLDEGKI